MSQTLESILEQAIGGATATALGFLSGVDKAVNELADDLTPKILICGVSW